LGKPQLRFDLLPAGDYHRRVNLKSPSARTAIGLAVALLACDFARAETFRVAAYNLENYLDQPGGTRPLVDAPPKSALHPRRSPT
jgi:hypothetical protein